MLHDSHVAAMEARRKQLTDAIMARYASEGPRHIAEEFGIQRRTVTIYARRLGVRSLGRFERSGMTQRQSKAGVNVNYFDEWGPNVAYVLGYIWADGCVHRNGEAGLQLSFGITTSDEHLLLDILADMRATVAVHRRGKSQTSFAGKATTSNPFTTATISSVPLVNCLMTRHGIPFRKTYANPEFPPVPDQFVSHFARGFLDGDGCVTLRTTRGSPCGSVQWIGSPRFVLGLQQAIVRLAGVPALTVAKSKGLVSIRWSAKQDIHRLHRWVYQGSPELFLKRKREVWDNLLAAIGPEDSGHYRQDREWTLEELAALRPKHSSWVKVAESIGMSPSALNVRRRRLGGLSRRVYMPQWDLDSLLSVYATERSWEKVAERIGANICSLRAHLTKLRKAARRVADTVN